MPRSRFLFARLGSWSFWQVVMKVKQCDTTNFNYEHCNQIHQLWNTTLINYDSNMQLKLKLFQSVHDSWPWQELLIKNGNANTVIVETLPGSAPLLAKVLFEITWRAMAAADVLGPDAKELYTITSWFS